MIFFEIIIASIAINLTLGILQYGSSYGEIVPDNVRNQYVAFVPTVDQSEVRYITTFWKKARKEISRLPGVSEIYDIGRINLNMGANKSRVMYSYSDELFGFSNINLIKGDKSSYGYHNGVNYVFASRDSGFEYGREYLLSYDNDQNVAEKMKVKITGIFEAETKALYIQFTGSLVKLDDFYIPFDECIAGADIKNVAGKDISKHADPNVIVKLEDGVNFKSVSPVWDKTVSSFLNYFTLQEMIDSLNQEIFDIAKPQLAIAFILLLMCIVGIGSSSIIKMIKETREYSIYYLCGQTWTRSITVNAVSNILSILLPFFIGIVAARIISIMPMTNMIFNINNILISFIVIIILFLITGFWSAIYLAKTPPIQFLRRNNN